jgi:hypothetical protein
MRLSLNLSNFPSYSEKKAQEAENLTPTSRVRSLNATSVLCHPLIIYFCWWRQEQYRKCCRLTRDSFAMHHVKRKWVISSSGLTSLMRTVDRLSWWKPVQLECRSNVSIHGVNCCLIWRTNRRCHYSLLWWEALASFCLEFAMVLLCNL